MSPPGHEVRLARALGDRPVQSWPAVASVDAVAQDWARRGGADGSVVVAGHQAAPRGRGGRPWSVDSERDVVLSMIVRPDLPAEREGWLYTLAVLATSDVTGGTLTWPDVVVAPSGAELGSVSVHGELGPAGVDWAVVTFLLVAPSPREEVTVRVVERFEHRRELTTDHNLAEHRERCSTIGTRVAARLVPLGPAGPVVTGAAVDVLGDGALVIETDDARRVAVRPQNLGILDVPDDER